MIDNIKHVEEAENGFSDFVMVPTTIAEHFKCFATAGILGYLVSEQKYYRDKNNLDSLGYFWCKAEKSETKFGMSRKVQDPIIKRLKDAGLIEVQTRQVEGSSNKAKIRHFKVNHTNMHNLVYGIKQAAKPIEVEELPEDLALIRTTLKNFVESKGSSLVGTL